MTLNKDNSFENFWLSLPAVKAIKCRQGNYKIE